MQVVVSRERTWFATLLEGDSRITVRGLHSTLSYSTIPLDPNLNPLTRRLFVLDDTHQNYLGIWDENTVIIWDLTRGVKALTLSSSSSDSKKKSTSDKEDSSATPARYLDAKAFGDRWYIAVVVQKDSHPKLQIHEYQNVKLVRIIKAGRFHHPKSEANQVLNSSVFEVTNDYILVKTDDQIRVLNKKTGSKITKISQKHITLSTIFQACQTLVVVVDDETHHVQLYDISSGRRYQLDTAIAVEKTLQVILFPMDNHEKKINNVYTLLVDGTTLYQIGIMESKDDTASVELSRTIGKDDSTLVQLLLANTTHTKEKEGESFLLFAINTQTWQTQTWNWDEMNASLEDQELNKRFEIIWTETTASSSTSANVPSCGEIDESKSNKRKATKPLSILGPGQAGGEATVQELRKRHKKDEEMMEIDDTMKQDHEDDENHDNGDDDENAPTIQERLRQLREAMHAESSSSDEDEEDDDDGNEDSNKKRKKKLDPDDSFSLTPKNATTESLKKLLQQAVSSGDAALLEVALQVRDAKIIAKTLDKFLPNRKRAAQDNVDDDDDDDEGRNSGIISTLLAELTQRLASKPARADQLVPWIREVLLRFNAIRYHNIDDPADEDVQALQTLQNLLQERLEIFPALLQLEGRLQQYLADI